MPVKLGAGMGIELRWWWEGAPRGAQIGARDSSVARYYLAPICARPDGAATLRRFLHEGTPGRVLPVGDGDLLDRAVAAVASGRLRITKIPGDGLSSFGDSPEEEVVEAPVAPPRAPAPPAEEICWPCLRAAASARVLREAAADGAPFVAELGSR